MRIGPYEVLSEIGRGGVGVVFRARAADGSPVALKVLLKTTVETRARFERERRLLASFGEPEGFVPLVDSGDTPQGPYLVMPFVTGGTLRARLEAGPLGVDETLELMSELARAVGTAHARGIVHRDLKPENILFTAQGNPLVTDLGLAKHFSSASPGASQSVSLSRDGEFRGTVGYMPLEQMTDARASGAQADVFALGAILHECLSGEPPFSGDSLTELLDSVRIGRRAPLPPNVPGWLRAVIDRALARTPEARYADANALREALATAPAPVTRRRAVLGVVLLALAVVLVLGAIALRRPGAPSAPKTFPDECRGFLVSRRSRLAAVWGSFAPKEKPLARFTSGFKTAAGRGTLTTVGSTIVVSLLHTEHEIARFSRHASEVLAVRAAPGADRVLSGDRDGHLWLWELATGAPEGELKGHAHRVLSIAWNADGSRAASGSDDGEIVVHDTASHGELARFRVGAAPVTALAFTRDGERLLVGFPDGTITLRDFVAGRPSPAFARHAGRVNTLDVSPDGKQGLSASDDGTARCFDLETAAILRTIEPGYGAVLGAAFTSNLSATAGCRDGPTILWQFEPRTLQEFRAGINTRMMMSPLGAEEVGELDFFESYDLTHKIWLAPATGDHRDTITALAFSRDGTRALTGSADRSLELREVASGRVVRSFLAHDGDVRGVAFLPDGESAVSAGTDGTVRRFDLATGRAVTSFVGAQQPLALALTEDGKRAVIGAANGTVEILDLAAGTGRRPFVLPTLDRAQAVGVLGNQAVFGGPGGVFLLDLDSGAIVPLGTDDRDKVACGFVRDRPGVVSATDLAYHEWERSKPGRSVELEKTDLSAAAVSPDGRRILAADFKRGIALYSLETGVELDRIDLGTSGESATAVAFSPDGRSFLAGLDHGCVLRFEIADGP